jgi:hypothetical protein
MFYAYYYSVCGGYTRIDGAYVGWYWPEVLSVRFAWYTPATGVPLLGIKRAVRRRREEEEGEATGSWPVSNSEAYFLTVLVLVLFAGTGTGNERNRLISRLQLWCTPVVNLKRVECFELFWEVSQQKTLEVIGFWEVRSARMASTY